LIDDIINSVNDLVYQGISSLENGLFSTPAEKLGFKPAAHSGASGSISDDGPEYPDAKQEIEEGLHKLETLLESTVDKNFDRFEIYVLRNILSVPVDLAGWIRLSHYEVLRQTMNPYRAALPY
jgi:kinetochore protein Mis12/MTW1